LISGASASSRRIGSWPSPRAGACGGEAGLGHRIGDPRAGTQQRGVDAQVGVGGEGRDCDLEVRFTCLEVDGLGSEPEPFRRRSTMRTLIRLAVAAAVTAVLVWLPTAAQAGITVTGLD
jgi:hypothetical protein